MKIDFRLSILLFFFTSCFNKPIDQPVGNNDINDIQKVRTDTVELLSESIKKINEFHETVDKTYIILPGSGCPPCMQPAMAFLKKHINEINKYTFIITEFTKLSELEDELGSELFNNDYLILDSDNHMGLSGFYSIYPQVIKVKNQRIEIYKQMDYNNLDLWRNL